MSTAVTTRKYLKGDKVSFKNRNGKLIKGVVKRESYDGSIVINGEDASRYVREKHEVIYLGGSDVDSDTLEAVDIPEQTSNGNPLPPISDKIKDYDINQRFTYLSQLVRMTISGKLVSLIITGEGGLGKTYTVTKEVERKNLVKGQDYVHIKGFSTARGLYRTLYENSDKLVIFDDCDEVLEDKNAKNILKGALDSYDERTIHWITKSADETLPDSFEFTGTIIFISNINQSKLDGALLSRSASIDVSMNRSEKLERMRHITKNSKDFMPQYPMQMKQEALDIIEENLDDVRELSLRSLGKVLKTLSGDSDMLDPNDPDYEKIDLKELCRFMLLS